MSDNFKQIIRSIWILIVFCFVLLYGYSKQDVFTHAIGLLQFHHILVAMILLLLSKFCLVFIMWRTCHQASIPISKEEGFHIYNTTQIAKYIPGSIWQYVGRFVSLKEKGYDIQSIKNAIIKEHTIVLGGAFIFALSVIFFYPSFVLGAVINIFPVSIGDAAISITSFLLLIIVIGCLLIFGQRFLRHPMKFLKENTYFCTSCFLSLINWILMGLAFWVILLPFINVGPLSIPFFIIGVYCLAFLCGFFTPFAPAGIGVREVVIALCISHYIPFDQAILLASINRIIYFSIEVILVFTSYFLITVKKIEKKS